MQDNIIGFGIFNSTLGIIKQYTITFLTKL